MGFYGPDGSEVRTLHGDLCRDDRVIGSWSAKWMKRDRPGPGGLPTDLWDCHLTVRGVTERMDLRMPATADDLQVMVDTIARLQIAHGATRALSAGQKKEEKGD